MMVTGGTLANTIGLLVARCRVFPESRKQGLTESNIKPILLITADTIYHYSHIAAFWWLGLGEENIVKINMLNDYRLDYNDLETKLITYNNGKTSKVVAVVAQAGDSRTTTIENFEKIALTTRKYNVWLHVDACHGGVALFSKNLKEKMQGIEMADSVSIDPHKGLGIPYSSQKETSSEESAERAPAKAGGAFILPRSTAAYSDGGGILKCMDLHLFRIRHNHFFGMLRNDYGQTKIFSLRSQKYRT